MFANLYIDDEVIDAYKCRHSWSDIINPTKKKSISVGYYYEDGYGSYNLYIYIRNILTKKIFTIVHDEPNQYVIHQGIYWCGEPGTPCWKQEPVRNKKHNDY